MVRIGLLFLEHFGGGMRLVSLLGGESERSCWRNEGI
jgi:hypothetical protein